MSTPERNRCTAVVWRMVCVLIRLVDKAGNFRLAVCADRLTRAWIPNRVIGCFRRFKNTGSLSPRPLMREANLLAVFSHNGHQRSLPPFLEV